MDNYYRPEMETRIKGRNLFNGSPGIWEDMMNKKGVNGEMKSFNNFEIVSKLSQ